MEIVGKSMKYYILSLKNGFLNKKNLCDLDYGRYEKIISLPSNEVIQEVIKKGKHPWNNSTAYELNPLDRVKMQATIQKWVDHSISSTINLPKEATEEDVANIYMEAWKLGCKGITIYRDGCRDGVLVSKDTKLDTSHKTNNATKRPKYVPCDIFTPTTHGQQYVVAVGIVDDEPYEVFAFRFDGKFKLNEGYIKKVNRGRYDIVTLDKEIYSEDITSEMSQIEEDRTRLISWGLRHGGGIKFLVEQLGKTKGNGFQSFSRIIGRTLKRYIKDNDKVTGTTCENCGSSDLIYKDGCSECQSCSSSKCN
jgi:ribonucleoside-diphosphate reductase alpha chain